MNELGKGAQLKRYALAHLTVKCNLGICLMDFMKYGGNLSQGFHLIAFILPHLGNNKETGESAGRGDYSAMS